MKQEKRKFPWKYLFGAMAAYGAAKLINLLVNFVPMHKEAASIGIIGGADGPTAIFVTSAYPGEHIVTAILMIAGIWGFLWLTRKGQK